MEDDNKKVEGTEEKPESLIDRFWWVIPPVFLTFISYPLIRYLYYALEILRYCPQYPQFFGGSCSGALLKSIHYETTFGGFERFEHIRLLFSFGGGRWVKPLFMFGFMGIGFIITKKMSLKYKILISSILGMIGLWVGDYAYFIFFDDWWT